jgi:hypothetical protein
LFGPEPFWESGWPHVPYASHPLPLQFENGDRMTTTKLQRAIINIPYIRTYLILTKLYYIKYN